MSIVDAALPLSEGCVCVSRHHPSTYVPNQHHVLPESWGGPTVPGNLVTICASTHTSAHALIDLHVKLGRVPTRAEVVAHMGHWPVALVRELAARAWAQRPEHPTYTS